MKFLWVAVQNGSFYVNMKSLDEGSKSWYDLRICQYCDCDIQWTAHTRIWASVSLHAEDIWWRSEFTTLLSQDLSSRQGHSHEKLLGKRQHSLSLADDSQAHPLWPWSLVSPPIMVTITPCVTLVPACIMPSHTRRGKVSRPRRGQIEDMRPCVRPKVGLGTDWVCVSRCVMFAAVPRLASRHSRLLGRSGDWWWPDSGRPHIPGPAHSPLRTDFISELGSGE